ncbi:MAG TPA: transposase, partial [Thermodesulfobacteriota bacterium]|nr:transposase [Thermodesulfobacteriota bacterium]
IIETKAQAIRDFIISISGTVHVTFEEGAQAAWLYDLIYPLVAEVVVCNPRANNSSSGNKSDRIDANKLAQMLRMGSLRAVYHGQAGVRTLKELVHSYESLVSDMSRVMNRIKAIYRATGIPCRDTSVYKSRYREQWLSQLGEAGARKRAQYLYRELDTLGQLRREARRDMILETHRHRVYKVLRLVPGLGPVRIAQIIATVGTPYRFRTKRQFWAYCGLAVVTRSSAEYEFVGGKVRKRHRAIATRGLNHNYNHRMKGVFKGAAINGIKRGIFKQYYEGLLRNGMRAEMGRLQVARKIGAIVLAIWKRGENFDHERVTRQTAKGQGT